MDFEWRVEKDKKLTFEDRVHNLACFEIVLNILRMKTKSEDEDIEEEMQALCGFALDCMFKDINIDDDMFDSIMELKDKTVNKFKANMLKKTGIPREVMGAPEIGEA